MADHTPLTDQQLDELETLAKNIPGGPWTVDDTRAELLGSHGNLLADLWDDRLGAYFAAMHAATQPLIDEVCRLRAQTAAVNGLCDEQDMAARAFEASTPAWIRAVRAVVQSADVDQMATALRREGFSADQVATMLSTDAAPIEEADRA